MACMNGERRFVYIGYIRALCFVSQVINTKRVFMARNIRDRTGRYCFDVFGGEKVEGGTGQDGKKMKIVVAWTGRDGTVGVISSTGRDGRVQ